MKHIITIILSITALVLTIYFINPITDYLAGLISKEPVVVIRPTNEYTKEYDYLYVQRTDNFTPYSYHDLLNIFYTIINNGWKQFTFYCPKEYTECINDVIKIRDDKVTLSHISNYVHTYNGFKNIGFSTVKSGEVNLTIDYLYDEDEIKEIDKAVDDVLKKVIKNDMSDYEKIKAVHDYIANNTKYDVERAKKKTSPYTSQKAYGPAIQGYATCNGYAALMSIYLSKMGFNNYRIATTADQISYSDEGHIWNAVYVKVDDKKGYEWLHIDLTWDDPVSNDNKDYLFHTYFLVNNEAMKKADDGEVVLEEHNFIKQFYLEFND